MRFLKGSVPCQLLRWSYSRLGACPIHAAWLLPSFQRTTDPTQ